MIRFTIILFGLKIHYQKISSEFGAYVISCSTVFKCVPFAVLAFNFESWLAKISIKGKKVRGGRKSEIGAQKGVNVTASKINCTICGRDKKTNVDFGSE